jgi:hypothetical protein
MASCQRRFDERPSRRMVPTGLKAWLAGSNYQLPNRASGPCGTFWPTCTRNIKSSGPMRRLQLVESKDFAWCPRAVRDGGTDWLGFLANAARLLASAAPKIRAAWMPRVPAVFWTCGDDPSISRPYSVRSALSGEMAAARPAGMRAATNAQPPSDPAATVSETGSQNDTP